METDDPVVLRQATAGDLGFIFSTWLRDLRDADPSALPDDLWFPAHRAHVERVLADPGVTVLVAAAADDPNEILGYVVAEPEEVLHWVLVRKGDLRGRGLAKRMLTAANCPPGTPAAWATRDSRLRLKNPCRSRQIRRRAARSSTGSKSASCTSA